MDAVHEPSRLVATGGPNDSRRVGAWRSAAGWGLWALLAGYLIFNRPFAYLGWPPVFIGEIVLAFALLTLAADWRAVFIEPLRRSWVFRLIAVFLVYSVARALLDGFSVGSLALRDGAIAGYALLAFVAPALWQATRRAVAADVPAEKQPAPLEPLIAHVAGGLLPIATAAALFAAGVYFDWLGWPGVKADFLTISAAVAAWSWFALGPRLRHGRLSAALVVCWVVAFWFALLTLLLPTRAVWVSVLPLAALLALACATTGLKRVIVAAVLVAVLVGAGVLAAPRLERFAAVSQQYALAGNLDFSIAELEARLRQQAAAGQPEVFPEIARIDHGREDWYARGERLAALFDPGQLDTVHGQLAAHALDWRAAFWQRVARYTWQHAPLTGVGFGTNLTNTLRHTPAWELFIPSYLEGNRSPHCGHLTVFARLGLLGLLVWLGILLLTIAGALCTLWTRARSGQRALFWQTLGVLGAWTILVCAISFGVVLENPFGGMWFWALTGVLAREAAQGWGTEALEQSRVAQSSRGA